MTKKHGSLLGALVLAALLLVPVGAWADSLMKSGIPPVIMILFDTSGSMEHDVGNNEIYGCTNQYKTNCCESTWPSALNKNYSYAKTRTLIAKEVMTGSFDVSKYYCAAYTAPNGLTYYDVPNTVPQFDDGVLGRYESMVKFGFVGFDPWDETGDQYSYASAGPGSDLYWYSNCALTSCNYGIQGLPTDTPSDRAPLLIPAPSDSPAVYAQRNKDIRQKIRATGISGGTPTAAALSDLNVMFGAEPDLNANDPYAECRPKAVIVITDGVPNTGEGSATYNTSDYQTGRLFAERDIRSYVVGFAAGDGPKAVLRAMAVNGGTCPPPSTQCDLPCAGDTRCYNGECLSTELIPNCYFAADNADGLRMAMATVIADILNGKTSRTKPATTTRVSFRKQEVGMYEVMASFQIEGGNPRWKGHLERVTYKCVDGELQPVQVLDIADQVSMQANCEELDSDCGQSRNILTRTLDGKLVIISEDGAGEDGAGDDDDDDDDGDDDDGDDDDDDDDENPFTDACEGLDASRNETFLVTQHADGYWYLTINPSNSYTLKPYKCMTDFDCEKKDEVCMSGVCGKPQNKCSSTPDCCATGDIKNRDSWWADWVAPTGPIPALDNNPGCNKACYFGQCILVKHANPSDQDCHRHQGYSGCIDPKKVCHVGKCTEGRVDGCSAVTQLQTSDLGSIHHSNPVIVGAPEMDLPYPSYKDFATETGDRDTMLYVGGNDGMMHAFLLGAFRPKDTPAIHREGMEMWSFVPKAVYKNLAQAAYGQGYFVDGQFTVRDLRLYRNELGEKWITTIVAGLRRGGREYYALDISDPIWDKATANVKGPMLLWELTNEELGMERLGYTYGKAEVGTVVITYEGKLQEMAVAFLPGGVPPDAADGFVGKAFYVVRLSDGKLIRRFDLGVDDPALVGSPAAYNTFPGAQVSRLFVGDQKGGLWRIDTSSTDPSAWSAEKVFDPADHFDAGTTFEPVFFKPAIAKNQRGELVVVFGNGDIDNLSSHGQKGNYIASLTEKVSYDDGIDINVDVNWVHPFENSGTWRLGEKVTGDPLIFDKVVYFSTFVPGDQACDFGWGRLAAFHFEDMDLNPVVDMTGDGTKDLFLNFGPETIVYGAEVTARPTCFNTDGGAGSFSVKQTSKNKPQLSVQTGTRAFTNQGSPPTTTTTQAASTIAESVQVDLPFPAATLMPLSWTLVLQ